MAEHIKQKIERGKKSICDFCFHQKVCKGIGNQPCAECSHYQDAADVAPVRHGRWAFIMAGQQTSAWCCSECGRSVVITCDEELRKSKLEKEYPFCHCGAMMDLEVPENETL